MSELPPPDAGSTCGYAAGAHPAASSGSMNGINSTFQMVHPNDTSQVSFSIEGPSMSPLVAQKRPRLESAGSARSDHKWPTQSVAIDDTSHVASINDDDIARGEQGGHSSTGGEDQMVGDEEDESGETKFNRQFFLFTIDSTLPLGVSAFSPAPDLSTLWQVRGVAEGSQAENLGIEVSFAPNIHTLS